MTRLHSPLAACLTALLSVGCAASQITPTHAPRAPMFDHAGQVRVSGGAGISAVHGPMLAADVAIAPVDGFAMMAGVDADPSGETTHVAGDLAVGAFLPRHRWMRLEGYVGLAAGYATGWGEFFRPGATTLSTADLSGPYLRPYAQVVWGVELPYFEAGVGARLSASLMEVHGAPRDGGPSFRSGYERGVFSPFATVAFVYEAFRLELVPGAQFLFAGESGPQGLGPELNPIDFYVLTRVGVEAELFE